MNNLSPDLVSNLNKWLTSWAKNKKFEFNLLAGDASSRIYGRLFVDDKTYIVQYGPDPIENMSYFNIGNHLLAKGLNLPAIQAYNLEQGFFLLEDLGDYHLASVNDNEKIDFYFKAIDLLIKFQKIAHIDFNENWCHQTTSYHANMVYEKEIEYFFSMCEKYLRLKIFSNKVYTEAKHLADSVTKHKCVSLIHRDFQSRNLMIKSDEVFLIDWQGSRFGPWGYDLVSLIADPYAELSFFDKKTILNYYFEKTGKNQDFWSSHLIFLEACRMMQALGAYSSLSLNFQKKQYEKFMPEAMRNLFKLSTTDAFSDYVELKNLITHAKIELEKRQCAL